MTDLRPRAAVVVVRVLPVLRFRHPKLDTSRERAHTVREMTEKASRLERVEESVSKTADEVRRGAGFAGPDQVESTSLLGPTGERVARDLAAFAMGRKTMSAMVPGIDRSADGTLRLTVDRASFEALGLRG